MGYMVSLWMSFTMFPRIMNTAQIRSNPLLRINNFQVIILKLNSRLVLFIETALTRFC
jgi:hypothetical protein